MNKLRAWFFALVLCALASGVGAHGMPVRSLPEPVTEALAQAGVPRNAVGVYVYDLTRGRPVLEVAPDLALNPASVIKLVTTFAALDVLGPAYTWKTEVWLDAPVNESRLEGNLYIKGYGDPKLTLEAMWLLLRDVRSRGIGEIAGNVVLDRSHFAPAGHDPALFDNEPTRPYNVGPDALLLNYNAFRLRFIPDDQKRSVAIIAEPPLPQVSVVNHLILAPGFCEIWPEKPEISGTTLTFRGVFPSSCGEKVKHFTLLAPRDYFGSVFRQLWSELGGKLAGAISDGVVPPGAKLLAAYESPPLSELVRDINKFSLNVMARHVYLTLGSFEGPPLDPEKSDRALREWLASRKLSFPELVMDNGSGLSRNVRISARHLGELLIAAWKSPLMPEFVSSLPLVAVDGTMRKRMPGSPVAGQAHIKTGYLDGVRSIAGYTRDASGRALAVAFLINHPSARYAYDAQDALLEWLYGYSEECCR
jgi:serine-type D-Ala-D-Ala carboxypeptidase/endopeptidase (penicillin-binding protein 4)